jgi:hypothetical protein
MLFRQVTKWTIVLLLLGAAGGWYAVRQAWERKDALLLEAIRTQVARQAPDWDVDIEEAKIVDMSREFEVRIGGFTIKPRGEDTPLLEIPESFITLDRDQLFGKHHQILVRRVRVSQPTVTLIRHEDGDWNWQKLKRLAGTHQTPEVEVEHGTFIVRVEAATGVPETEVASREVALSLLPQGMHRYLIEGASRIDGAGGLAFSGKIDLNSGAWELSGKADGLDMSPSMLEKAARLSPAVKRRVAELSGSGATLTPGAVPLPKEFVAHEGIRSVSDSRPVPDAASQLSLPHLGLFANIGVDFEVRSDGAQRIPDYRIVATVMEGQVTEPLSPVPLYGLQGELEIENDRVVIHDVSASNGESQLHLDGEISKLNGETVKRFNIDATNLWLDRQVRDLLPPERQRLFDIINPSGRFTVKASYNSEAERPLQLDQLTALDCTMRHSKFPYPITGITGTITQQDDRLRIALEGAAAARTVHIDGEVRGPGSEEETVVHVRVDRFPIDRKFTDAIVAPEHQGVRKAIESLNLTGLADLRLKFARSDGPDQRFRMGLDADVTEASLSFNRFPYEVTNLSGHVRYNPWREPIWRFTELEGQHEAALLTGAATFDLSESPGRLTLHVTGRNGQLDHALRHATVTANPALEQVWTELNPAGRLDVEQALITWTVGEPCHVTLPAVRVQEGTVQLRSFPYLWEQVTGEFSWQDHSVQLTSVEGRHGETRIFIKGLQEDPALFELPEDKAYRWKLRLPSIALRHFKPDREFVAALPPYASTVFQQLDPRGPIDADLRVEFKGFPDAEQGEIVTSDWHVDALLKNDRLSGGLDLTDVTGRVSAKATWNNVAVTADGNIDLARARALNMTFTNIRGPFTINGSEVTVGSAAVLRRLKMPADEQLTAALYGGVVTVNSVVQLDPYDAERSRYQTQVDVENVDLRKWAEEWGFTASNVTGTVNGMMNLYGQGTDPLQLRGDSCWMQITDARIGELPVMAQLLGQLTQLQQPDATAFKYAYAQFSVRNGMFEFGSPASQQAGDGRRIQLHGDMLNMVGQGVVPFAPGIDPRMNLDLYSKIDTRMIPRLPFLDPLLNPLARSFVDNWFHIEVTGTPAEPQIRVKSQVPIGNVNTVLREFLNAVEKGVTPVLPPPMAPRR